MGACWVDLTKMVTSVQKLKEGSCVIFVRSTQGCLLITTNVSLLKRQQCLYFPIDDHLGFVSEEKNDGIKYFLIFFCVGFFPQKKTNKVFFI